MKRILAAVLVGVSGIFVQGQFVFGQTLSVAELHTWLPARANFAELAATGSDFGASLVGYAPRGSEAVSTTATGASISPTSGLSRNQIINGQFQIWQLGDTFKNPASLAKNADRWNFAHNGTIGTLAITKQSVPTSAWKLDFNPKYCINLSQTVPGSGNTLYDLSTQIEGVGTLSGKQVVISLWAIAAAPVTLAAIKTEQYFGSGGSPSSSLFTTSAGIRIGTTWQRYHVNATLAQVNGRSLGTNGDDTLNVIITMPLNQTFNVSITNVQIEEGSGEPTPFEYTPIEITMARCQRYLQSSYDNDVAPGTITAQGAVFFIQPAATSLFSIPLIVPMRVPPYVVYYNPATGAAGSWNGAGTALPATTNTIGTKNITVKTVGGTSGAFCSGHYVLQDPYL